VNELGHGYTVEFGRFERERWDGLLGRFEDASIYQTWSYEMPSSGHRRVVHMLLRKNRVKRAAAQVRVMRFPVINVGIAYVRWGPLWKAKGVPMDLEVFRQAVRALRNEFSVRHHLALRIYPLAFKSEAPELERILQEEGFLELQNARRDRTLIMDLTVSLHTLRATLDQKWRNCLNRAEKNGLELKFGEEPELFEQVELIYSEMIRRKNLSDVSDIAHLRRVQPLLPTDQKLKIIVCSKDGQPVAGGIFSAIGDMALYMVGATSDAGMKTKGSYLIQWSFVNWLKENGIMHYDLHGFNPETNPGTYHFKRGLAGKHGRNVEFLGKFQVADSQLSALIVNAAERLSYLLTKPQSHRGFQ
jgi:hypothetical protein